MADDPHATNRRNWNERAAFHLDTPMYRAFVERLRSGGDALLAFDDAVLGDLRDLDVLHLQCHVGTDTLSLARRGARVLGVDYSPRAIAKARELADELGIAATFVEGDVLDLPAAVTGPFDLVYTSYGVLCWLGDLQAWARNIASRLRVGGRLVLIDGHPLSNALADRGIGSDTLTLGLEYLGNGEPERCDDAGSYADLAAHTEHNTTFEWAHGLGEVVTAVATAGLTVESLTEHPEGFYGFSPTLVCGTDRLWRLPAPLHGRYPLTFSLVARR